MQRHTKKLISKSRELRRVASLTGAIRFGGGATILVNSFATGYIPRSWRDITVKFIPKGGRASYEKAKSFRPISLTSSLLKCLERIIDHHIRDVYLANMQSGKSTVTLLHKVVYDIEKAFAQKQSCLRVFLDIEGAFDNVSFDANLEAARNHGLPTMITNWIHQMLKNRHLFSTLRQAAIRKFKGGGRLSTGSKIEKPPT